MKPDDCILVLGATGLVGSAIVRKLKSLGFHNLLTPSRQDLDLRHGPHVTEYLHAEGPSYVFHAAGTVGGIWANREYPATFLSDNLSMGLNVIRGLGLTWPGKLLLLGSSCVYPRDAEQPMVEEALLTGPLEETNEAYAIAKIATIKLGQAMHTQYGFRCISLMPPNLYGPGDSYCGWGTHAIPALIHRFHNAKVDNESRVSVWGNGKPVREVMYVDDVANACVHMMQRYEDPRILNVGSGQAFTVAELVRRIRAVVGYEGDVVWDTNVPNGTPDKRMDSTRAHALGWRAITPLAVGLSRTYDAYLEAPP